MIRNEKAQVRILEAFLAVLLIFSSFVVSASLFTLTTNVSRNDGLESLGMQALLTLDSEGVLGQMIDEGNWTGIRESLKAVLPSSVAFNLTVYDDSGHKLNDVSISSNVLEGSELVCVEYLCASRNSRFNCYVLQLQLAVVR